MPKPEQYILDEWDAMCVRSHLAASGDCPLIGDGVILEMNKYIHELEEKCEELEDEVSHWLCSYTDATYEVLEI